MKPSELKSEIRSWLQVETPLGRLGAAGVLVDMAGTGFERMRTLDLSALVLLIAGGGRYCDAGGVDQRLEPGDWLFIPAGCGHMYGPESGDSWTEAYITFGGTVFAGWSAPAVGSETRVCRLGEPGAWLPRWKKVADMTAHTPAEAVAVLAEIHLLLNEVLRPQEAATGAEQRLEQSRRLVATWPSQTTPDWEQMARMCHLSYESWRKVFRHAFGEPPARYRRRMLMEQAGELMRRTNLTNERLAEQFGCADAFHFSKMFKAVHGTGPAVWRHQVAPKIRHD